jgi:hypothetical protein
MSVILDPERLIVIVPQSERAAAWKGKKLTRQGSAFKETSKAETEVARKLRREIEKQQQQAKAARAEARRAEREEFGL